MSVIAIVLLQVLYTDQYQYAIRLPLMPNEDYDRSLVHTMKCSVVLTKVSKHKMENFDGEDYAEVENAFREGNLSISREGILEAGSVSNPIKMKSVLESKQVMDRRHCRVLTDEHEQIAHDEVGNPSKYLLQNQTSDSQLPNNLRSDRQSIAQNKRCQTQHQNQMTTLLNNKRIKTDENDSFDKENILDLIELINEPTTVCYGPRIKAHWLSTKGIQPNIPENPTKDSPPTEVKNCYQMNGNNPQMNVDNVQMNVNIPEINENNPQIKANNPQIIINRSQIHVNTPQMNINRSQMHVNNTRTNVNNPQIIVEDQQTQVDHLQKNVDNLRMNVNSPQMYIHYSQMNADNLQMNVNSPEGNVNNPQINVKNQQMYVNNPRMNFNKPQKIFNNLQKIFNNPQANLKKPKMNFKNSQTHFKNAQMNFNNPKMNFNISERNFNNPEMNLNEFPQMYVNNLQNNVNNNQIYGGNPQKIVNNSQVNLDDPDIYVNNRPKIVNNQRPNVKNPQECKKQQNNNVNDQQQQENVCSPHANVNNSYNNIKAILNGEIVGESIESQMYYFYVTKKCISDDQGERLRAFRSVASDLAFTELMPKFVHFISNNITTNIFKQDCVILSYLVQFSRALIKNPYMNLVSQVHVILPSLISCAITKQMTVSDPGNSVEWELRDNAARTLGLLNLMYKRRLPTLEIKLVKVSCALMKQYNASYETLYGSMSILSHLGVEIAWMHVAPIAAQIEKRIKHSISSQESTSINALLCYQKLVDILSDAYMNKLNDNWSNYSAIFQDRDLISNIIGESLMSEIEKKISKSKST
ncbi:hypothetical protein GJ496_003307 [Pomphorhynchus laevis]|nr:hypothetical protein GJ496_003307 [Pomphorhynchus laevis]